MRIALTGGIACGKSLLSSFLNDLGVETLDADDVVHELVPPEERRKLAQIVFKDAAARKALEARLHPLVKARIDDFLAASRGDALRLAVVPLLFETGWDRDYDLVCCLASERETQIRRMMETRRYSRAEAESRIAAQMSVDEKAARSDYVIRNDGSVAELKAAAERFVAWLANRASRPRHENPESGEGLLI